MSRVWLVLLFGCGGRLKPMVEAPVEDPRPVVEEPTVEEPVELEPETRSCRPLRVVRLDPHIADFEEALRQSNPLETGDDPLLIQEWVDGRWTTTHRQIYGRGYKSVAVGRRFGEPVVLTSNGLLSVQDGELRPHRTGGTFKHTDQFAPSSMVSRQDGQVMFFGGEHLHHHSREGVRGEIHLHAPSGSRRYKPVLSNPVGKEMVYGWTLIADDTPPRPIVIRASLPWLEKQHAELPMRGFLGGLATTPDGVVWALVTETHTTQLFAWRGDAWSAVGDPLVSAGHSAAFGFSMAVDSRGRLRIAQVQSNGKVENAERVQNLVVHTVEGDEWARDVFENPNPNRYMHDPVFWKSGDVLHLSVVRQGERPAWSTTDLFFAIGRYGTRPEKLKKNPAYPSVVVTYVEDDPWMQVREEAPSVWTDSVSRLVVSGCPNER